MIRKTLTITGRLIDLDLSKITKIEHHHNGIFKIYSTAENPNNLSFVLVAAEEAAKVLTDWGNNEN